MGFLGLLPNSHVMASPDLAMYNRHDPEGSKTGALGKTPSKQDKVDTYHTKIAFVDSLGSPMRVCLLVLYLVSRPPTKLLP